MFIGNWQLGSAEGKAAALAQQLSVRLGHLGNQRARSWYTELETLYDKEGFKSTVKWNGTGKTRRFHY